MDLRARVSIVAGRPVIDLTGPLDLATVPVLQNTVARVLLNHRGDTVAVDLDGVDSLDDIGLGVLLGAAGRARRGGGDLVVVCSNDQLLELLRSTGFDRAVTVVRSLAG